MMLYNKVCKQTIAVTLIAAAFGGCCCFEKRCKTPNQRPQTSEMWYAELYATSTPFGARVTSLIDGQNLFETPDKRQFTKILPRETTPPAERLILSFEKTGFQTAIRDAQLTHWARTRSDATLNSNKVHVNLVPCGDSENSEKKAVKDGDNDVDARPLIDKATTK